MMEERLRFSHRTLKANPSLYEERLSRILFNILSKGVHDLPGIVSALNATDLRPCDAESWSEERFVSEMETLGAYPNSAGAPIGQHPSGIVPPGNPNRERAPGGR
jgi:hypothetical protein